MQNLFQNLEFLGMLCLGAFVAGIMNYGLSHIKDTDTFSKVSASIFGATFSGVVFVFIEFFLKQHDDKTSVAYKSVFMYPVGLLLSLLWLQINDTIKRITDELRPLKIIGWLHFSGLSIVTILIIWKLIFGGKII